MICSVIHLSTNQLWNRKTYFIELFTATFFLFLIQGLFTLYILEDTGGRAGFELHKTISIHFFYLLLGLSLLCSATKSGSIISGKFQHNYNLHSVQKISFFLFMNVAIFVLTVCLVLLSFGMADFFRWTFTPIFCPLDDFYHFCFPEVISFKWITELFVLNPTFALMNLLFIGTLSYMFFMLCGYLFRRYAFSFAILIFSALIYGLYATGFLALYEEVMKQIYVADYFYYYISIFIGLVLFALFLLTICFQLSQHHQHKTTSADSTIT